MLVINIHQAKMHLSRLIDPAVKGESFVIAKAGKPLVKVVPLNAPEPAQTQRLGFMAGQISIPDDFDQMGRAEIAQLFGDAARGSCRIRTCCSGRLERLSVYFP